MRDVALQLKRDEGQAGERDEPGEDMAENSRCGQGLSGEGEGAGSKLVAVATKEEADEKAETDDDGSETEEEDEVCNTGAESGNDGVAGAGRDKVEDAGKGEDNPKASRRADTISRPFPSGRPRSDNSRSVVGAMKLKGKEQEDAVVAEEGGRQEADESAARAPARRDWASSSEILR